MAKANHSNASAGPVLPSLVFAHASVHSIGGASLFESGQGVNQSNVINYYSEYYLIQQAIIKLRAAGFLILDVNNITISIGAPAEVYDKTFNTKLVATELPTIKSGGVEDVATFILPENSRLPGTIDLRNTPFRDVLEGISINEPVYYMNTFLPPKQSYWHLSVPGDVSAALNADRVHRMNITGRGIRAVMVDSGWYPHPYFMRRGYHVNPVLLGPAASDASRDESGHGTGESANLFSIAPDVHFTMVKMSNVDSAGAFNRAVQLNPHVISCSWGIHKPYGPLSGNDLVLSAAIANAVKQGITVVFAIGNGHWGFPGQHPDVISTGGVYVDEKMELHASNYASGFTSTIFPGRTAPDVCGVVGMQPSAAYIMLPVPLGAVMDSTTSGNAHPQKDQTSANDGWAAFSGTSAAAPQIAGICALMKQANPALTPLQIKRIIQATAYDVTAGNSHPNTGGHAARAGRDVATGYGLANAYRAVVSSFS